MSPSPEVRPDDDERLQRLAEAALAAVVGDPPPADVDPVTARRVTVVVDAIRAAGPA
jgi:hypothetical protein